MNTPSHFIMTAALSKVATKGRFSRSALLLGSVLPDIPLYMVSVAALIYFPAVEGMTTRDTARYMFDTLYFHDPGWIASHNFFHAPLIILLGLALAWVWKRSRPARGRWVESFFLACLLHSFVDILTHYDDGPVLFWPLNWSYRFHSPVSYWDANHYGRQFAVFELVFDVVLIAYIVIPWVARRMAKTETATETDS